MILIALIAAAATLLVLAIYVAVSAWPKFRIQCGRLGQVGLMLLLSGPLLCLLNLIALCFGWPTGDWLYMAVSIIAGVAVICVATGRFARLDPRARFSFLGAAAIGLTTALMLALITNFVSST
jgi:hypothetical protein